MQAYDFQNIKTGEVREFMYSMKEVPSIGEEIEADGGRWVRLASGAGVIDKTVTPFASIQNPRGDKDWHKFDRHGRPIFTSKQDVREYCAKTGAVWDN